MQEAFLTILVVLVACGFALPVDFNQQVPNNNSGQFENVIKPQPQLRLALVNKKHYWPNGIVPYTIDPIFTKTQVDYIKDAMRHIETNSCIRFVERTNEKNYVRIESVVGRGCRAVVGMRGGSQHLRMEQGKCFNPKLAKGHAIHELMHSLGFFHQQNAANRDDYIQVVTDNIVKGKLGEFDKISENFASDFGFGYDYNSIMHYDNWAYQKGNKIKTMIPLDDPNRRMGQRQELSVGDIKKLNYMYNCP